MIRAQPGNGHAYYNRGVMNSHRARFEAAEHDFSLALELMPADAHIYVCRGHAIAAQGGSMSWSGGHSARKSVTAKRSTRMKEAMIDFSTALHLDEDMNL